MKTITRLAVSLLLLLGLASSAAAQNGLTVSTINVTANLDVIGVTAAYTGDANANATVSLQFQKHTGDTGLHSASPMFIDRRTTLDGTANPWASMARGLIVGLLPATQYDVTVTWTDADGVTGTNPTTTTVTTLTTVPPTGGTPRAVSSNVTQGTQLTAAAAGDTLTWDPAFGTYNQFSFSKSGTSGAWIVLDGNGATIDGTCAADGVNIGKFLICTPLAVTGNFVVVKGFHFADCYSNCISASGTVIVLMNTIDSFSSKCADNPIASGADSHYGDNAITVGSGSTNAVVYGNQITSSPALVGGGSCTAATVYDGPGTGISFSSTTNSVFKLNTVACNGCRDAISSDNSTNDVRNTGLENNVVSGYLDDGSEIKGTGLNTWIIEDIDRADGSGTLGSANSCMSNESTCGPTNGSCGTTNSYGPNFWIRGKCINTHAASGGSNATTAYKGPATAFFAYHVSVSLVTSPGGGTVWGFNAGGGLMSVGAQQPIVLLNNATKQTTGANLTDQLPTSTTTIDYGCDKMTSGNWEFRPNRAGTSVTTFAAFQGNGYDVHGSSGDPNFDSNLNLQAGSACIDLGTPIANINSADSKWPFCGTAPDAGAIESGGCAAAGSPGSLSLRSIKLKIRRDE